MSSKRILIAEDDEALGNLLKDTLEIDHYDVIFATNGKEAFDEFKKDPFDVVITDIEMPVMDGYELIVKLKEMDQEPTIFVVTANTENEFIIDVMKKGIYDYLIKPVDYHELSLKVKRAFESHELKRMNRIVEKEREIRLQQQLEWTQWQTKMEGKDGKSDKSLFHNMHVSFSQGTGFGALITLLNIVSNSAEIKDDHYEISKEMMDMVKKNTGVAENAINTFSQIEWIISNKLPLEKMSCHALHGKLEEVKNEASKFSDINNNKLLLSDKKPTFANKFVNVSTDHFFEAMFELTINAMKFSEKKSDVYILLDVLDEKVSISVINQAIKDEEGRKGIPMEYENIIFEPFFRMTKIVRESYNTFDYGLGLTKVDKILERHGGKVNGKNITDHSDISKGPVGKVEFNISLPVI